MLVGAINVCLILQSSLRLKNASAGARFVAAHRIGGYLFIALFCVMGYFMVARLGDVAAGEAPTTTIHLTLAMVLGPLLFVKVLVARYYKSYHAFLMPIVGGSERRGQNGSGGRGHSAIGGWRWRVPADQG